MPAAPDPTHRGHDDRGGRWHAIGLARLCQRPRVPFLVDDRIVGSVARDHLPALPQLGSAWHVSPDRVLLKVPPTSRDAALADANAALRALGLIRAWRDETYGLFDPATMAPLARMERAASRFWGTVTLGAHGTGWVAGGDGRPAQLWIAQRAFDKATDPGAYDNLVGGGVPLGQTPCETLLREGWEEAGLPPAVMRRATPGRVIRLLRDIAEGLQHELLYSHDLRLLEHEVPVNQDGEVHAFHLLPVADAVALAAGSTMTVDAALVTLDFALRHHLLEPGEHQRLSERSATLWLGPAP